ncbi:DUF177 domain-containing protein [Rhodobacteraceae bacterium KMM 6894]|nr:DUF177 domain-containing protein [Rhodobacteraceae bacterium KMM 6894]
MDKPLDQPEILRVAALPAGREVTFDITLNDVQRAEIASVLDLRALRKLRFHGALTPLGKRDWQVQATLGATAIQSCIVTLQAVTTRIDRPVVRRFLADMPETPDVEEGSETEMPEDDQTEPLRNTIDLGAIITESLALALPDYPRSDSADFDSAQFTAPGTAPLRDADLKPFAGLAALRDKLDKDS